MQTHLVSGYILYSAKTLKIFMTFAIFCKSSIYLGKSVTFFEATV